MTGMQDKQRVDDMYALYCDGWRQKEISEIYGITPQAVSFIFKKWGYDLKNGGHRMLSHEHKIDKAKARDDYYTQRHGLTYFEYKNLVSEGVTKKYTEQKNAAKRRGIPWHFNFGSWWKIWLDSGKWELRGRGDGRFAMARKGDIGPYSPENVEIVTHNQNSKDCRARYINK